MEEKSSYRAPQRAREGEKGATTATVCGVRKEYLTVNF
jgi:hypothetical protein